MKNLNRIFIAEKKFEEIEASKSWKSKSKITYPNIFHPSVILTFYERTFTQKCLRNIRLGYRINIKNATTELFFSGINRKCQ